MAKTNRLLKNRRFLIGVYIFILFLVGLSIGLLIFFYDENKGLISSDVEIFDDLQAEILDVKEVYQIRLSEIEKVRDENIDDFDLTTAEIDKLIQLHSDAKSLLSKVIQKNSEILELDLDEIKSTNAKSSIMSANQAQSEHSKVIRELSLQKEVAIYAEKLSESLLCFSKIDTDGSASDIDKDQNICSNLLDSAFTQLPSGYPFIKTEEYHNEIKRYWNLTVEINKNVEEGDQESVARISKDIQRSSDSRAQLQEGSREELNTYLRDLVQSE